MLCSLSRDAKKGKKSGKVVEEVVAGPSGGQLFEMFQWLEWRFEQLECLLDKNTEALELVVTGLSIYQQTRRIEEGDEEEGEKGMSKKAKGKRRQK